MASTSTNPLCHFAPVQPPAGQTSNLVDPPSLANTAIAICAIMTAWATVFVAGRLYVNFRKLSLADYLAFAALIFDIGYTVTILLTRHLFRHEWDVPICWFTASYMKTIFATSMLAPLAIGLSKATIFVLLFQIFQVRKGMRWAIWAGLIGNILIYFPNLIIAPILGAPHIGETWNDLIINQRPAEQKWIGTYQGPCAVLLDVYIFILPFPALSNLNMPNKKRLKLFVLFGTALLGVVASIIACVYRFRLIFAAKSDSTWADAQVYLPIVVENYVALIVGCMPAFASFLRLHVGGSRLYIALRTRIISNTSKGTKDSGPGPSDWKDGIETIGGGKVEKGRGRKFNQMPPAENFSERTGYYELKDTTLLVQTEAHVQSSGREGNQGPGITRTLDFNQSFDRPSAV